ncbi:MAG: DUF3883 domain-containing protein [Terrisporobacter sp.]
MNENEKILFAKVGWMRSYNGLEYDSLTGGKPHIDENNTGMEIYNYSYENGKYYGFVMSNGCIDIHKNLNAEKNDEYIDGVTVVWVATNPFTKKIRIIGWFKEARVYKNEQSPKKGSKRFLDNNNEEFVYNIEGEFKKSKLLEIDERKFSIPIASVDGYGMGRSNLWYCRSEKNKKFKKEVLDYINNYVDPKAKVRDLFNYKEVIVDKKQKVELNSINYVYQYYKELGYHITSVEEENVGWDLEAIKDDETLYVEIKGLAYDEIYISLSPNEYKNMKEIRENFRLCIVTNSLDFKKMNLHTFLYNEENEVWIDDEGNVLKIREILSANMFV